MKAEPFYARFSRLMRTPLGKLLYLNFNLSPRVLLPRALGKGFKLSKALHRQYLGPFPTPASRLALLAYARALVGASDWFETL